MTKKKVQTSNISNLLPPTNLAVLLILSEKPRHGYQINRVIDNRGMRNWVDLQFSTIYKTLDELETRGLVKGEKENKKIKQSRKIYTITELGRKILKEQIIQCIKNPPHPKALFDLGLSGISLLSKSEAITVLEEYRNSLEERIKSFEEILEKIENIDELSLSAPDLLIAGESASRLQNNPHLFIVYALFNRPYQLIQSELKWLKNFIQI
ncbi:MAG: PadR family transcriptional regulator, partial [Promethearchaeota archaeon]